MFYPSCANQIDDGVAFYPSCGHQVGATSRTSGTGGAVAGAVDGAVNTDTARLNKMADGAGAAELRFGDFFSETFKHHVQEAEEFFVCGAPKTIAMLDAAGDYAVGKANGTRPAGIVLISAEVSLVKPGDMVDLSYRVGESYASAKFMGVACIPDESKNKLQDKS